MLVGQKEENFFKFSVLQIKKKYFVLCPNLSLAPWPCKRNYFVSEWLVIHSCKESGEYKIIVFSPSVSQFVIGVSDTTEVRAHKF